MYSGVVVYRMKTARRRGKRLTRARRREREEEEVRGNVSQERKKKIGREERGGEPPVTAYPPVLISRCLQIGDKITRSR